MRRRLGGRLQPILLRARNTRAGWRAYASAGLAITAVTLPPRSLAAALVAPTSPRFEQVVVGVWIFKALLLLHALLLWSLARRPAHRSDRAAAIRSGAESTRGTVAALAVLLAVAAGLRLYGLGDGLWFDEILTLIEYVKLPLGNLVATFDSQNQHMLYSISAKVTTSLLGDSAAALRLPAALFGIGSIGALYWLAVQVASRTEALLASSLLAVSYHHVWFSQNARGYTGLLLWTLLASGLFIRMLRGETKEKRAIPLLYGITMALATFTHASALAVWLAHGAVATWRWIGSRRATGDLANRQTLLGLVLAATLSLQLYALVLPQMVETLLAPTLQGVSTAWKSPAWMVGEASEVLQRGVPGGAIALALGLVVLTAGVIGYARQSRYVTAVFLLPAAFMAATALSIGHNLWPRLFFFSAGFATLLLIRGIFVLCRALARPGVERLAVALCSLVIFVSAITVPGAWGPKQDYHAAARFIADARDPGDAVVTVDMSDLPFREYLGLEWDVVDGEAALLQTERTHPRTWVLYTFPTRLAAVQPAIWSRLDSAYVRAAVFSGTVGGGDIVVMVRE